MVRMQMVHNTTEKGKENTKIPPTAILGERRGVVCVVEVGVSSVYEMEML